MVAFAGTSLRVILEDGFKEAAIGDDGRLFSEPFIQTKTVLGDEIIIRVEEIAFVQRMTNEEWGKLKEDRDRRRTMGGDPPIIDPAAYTGFKPGGAR
jgi:hypothetical protein